MNKIICICSGGQTGIDRGALDCAKKHKVKIKGWCPKNFWAEDLVDLSKLYQELKETPSTKTSQRTYWNTRDSDATLIILPKSSSISHGTNLTIKAVKRYKKPYLVISSIKEINKVIAWLNTLKDGLILNVAGSRESECPNAYSISYSIVEAILTTYLRK